MTLASLLYACKHALYILHGTFIARKQENEMHMLEHSLLVPRIDPPSVRMSCLKDTE